MITVVIHLFTITMHLFGAQLQPQFKGGQRALSSFISSNLIYPDFSKENCLRGTVNVSFKVDRSGKVFDPVVIKGYGTDLDTEALRLVKLTSKRWIVPAGHDTTVALVLPVNFALDNPRCSQRSPDEIREALKAYRARQELVRTVYNFYDNKAAGRYDPAEEPRIIALKAELGLNEGFTESLIRTAQRKMKQGDKDGACEDLTHARRLGNDKAAKLAAGYCR